MAADGVVFPEKSAPTAGVAVGACTPMPGCSTTPADLCPSVPTIFSVPLVPFPFALDCGSRVANPSNPTPKHAPGSPQRPLGRCFLASWISGTLYPQEPDDGYTVGTTASHLPGDHLNREH